MNTALKIAGFAAALAAVFGAAYGAGKAAGPLDDGSGRDGGHGTHAGRQPGVRAAGHAGYGVAREYGAEAGGPGWPGPVGAGPGYVPHLPAPGVHPGGTGATAAGR
ncbi:hypothetical protein [Streptomyces albus]|uniref:hypothetical protein n=1 Tax=Streptomyces albus TaxID=1888 RepID=UPI0024AD3C64|nr:hypothetical protein [Streptomyces albus]MDI6411607.1 hypothetical protein [Streptomyces albus]